MPRPNVFISHRWANGDEYKSLVDKFDKYGFIHTDYSVPSCDPLDATKVSGIKSGLREQVRQCNYFIIFANLATGNGRWCTFELDVASEYGKPILSVKPYGYAGGVPVLIQNADTEGGPVGFNAPAIIRKICNRLSWPIPEGI